MSPAYRITALDHADQKFGMCFATRSAGKPCNVQPCSGSQIARYRCEAIDRSTGAVTHTQLACTNHAAWLAHQVGIAFPLASRKIAA